MSVTTGKKARKKGGTRAAIKQQFRHRKNKRTGKHPIPKAK